MRVHFFKYHGLGNDFLVFEDGSSRLKNRLLPSVVQALCARHVGIGADGILLRQDSSHADHGMILFNADGSQAEISGNGLRCFVLYLRDSGHLVESEVSIDTVAGILRGRIVGEGIVETTMSPPDFAMRGTPPKPLELMAHGKFFSVVPVNVGNPHGVIFGPERDVDFARTYGPALEHHEAFPEGANIEFVNVVSDRACRLVVWERGAGITQACGSGSVATACAGVAMGHFQFGTPVSVHQPGGELSILVQPGFQEIWQRGPAQFVFDGEVEIPS